MSTTPAARPPWHTARSRRAFLRALGAGALGALLGGCGGPGDVSTARAQPVQLVYQDWRTDWFPPMAQEMLALFHKQNPHIRVFYTPDPEDLEFSMLSDMEAGTAADVFQGCCSFFPIWAQSGYALDLRPYVRQDLDAATIQEWSPAQYRAFFLPNGVQFGLPKYHGALALYFNKDAFDAAGVAYPEGSWDHADYLAAMRRLTADRDGDGRKDRWGSTLDVSWERVQVHVNGWGGHLVDPDDPARCRMGEPQALEAMAWLRARMWDDGVMATALDVQNLETRHAFVQGLVAMVEDGSWALKDILNAAPFRVGVAPFPAGPERRVTLATTDGFGIYAGTRHPEAAWELLKFLVSKDYGRAMARTNLLQPARASLVDAWVGYIRSQFPAKAREVDVAAFADGHLKGHSLTAEVFANMDEAKRLTYAAWDQVFTLGQAPVDLMTDVCEQIERAQL